MRRLASLATALTIALTLAACGSEDDDEPAGQSTPVTSESPRSQKSATPEPSGELPSYDEVKAIWLEHTSEGDRTSCETNETEDRSIRGAADGEYLRFLCASLPRFDYVIGADNYAANFTSASRDLAGRAVFHIPGEAYVAPAGANTELAVAIQTACGCGEVLGPA
ncbi:hypothetical protein [Nocardioides sp. AE5]|uniref:hypothetical protein n=1 Tax=Nocardioides sp. AE5 TaxID=2962573 RepID=UPI002881DA11|nr:hypothetical protein [Nocardioides sp. AE5]MDT0203020.1 hypothetical protein [Nocardioides sp. AE5]